MGGPAGGNLGWAFGRRRRLTEGLINWASRAPSAPPTLGRSSTARPWKVEDQARDQSPPRTHLGVGPRSTWKWRRAAWRADQRVRVNGGRDWHGAWGLHLCFPLRYLDFGLLYSRTTSPLPFSPHSFLVFLSASLGSVPSHSSLTTMRSFALAAWALASATLIQANTIPGLPDCTSDCITSNYGGCGQLNVQCICANAPFVQGLACCISVACSPSDQQSKSFAHRQCPRHLTSNYRGHSIRQSALQRSRCPRSTHGRHLHRRSDSLLRLWRARYHLRPGLRQPWHLQWVIDQFLFFWRCYHCVVRREQHYHQWLWQLDLRICLRYSQRRQPRRRRRSGGPPWCDGGLVDNDIYKRKGLGRAREGIAHNVLRNVLIDLPAGKNVWYRFQISVCNIKFVTRVPRLLFLCVFFLLRLDLTFLYLLCSPHTVLLVRSVEVLVQNLVHSKHVHPVRFEDPAHSIIAADLALVIRILEITRSHVLPDLLDGLWTGEGVNAKQFRQRLRQRHWFL